jgi:hypothetical protein
VNAPSLGLAVGVVIETDISCRLTCIRVQQNSVANMYPLVTEVHGPPVVYTVGGVDKPVVPLGVYVATVSILKH